MAPGASPETGAWGELVLPVREGRFDMAQGKVLIVDDQTSFRRVLRLTLALEGFEITEASTGEEALALLDIGHYEAVLLDIDMPGMGGIETCRELRRRNPSLPILMLTVRDQPEDKAEAFDAGANDYMTKPFLISDLVARLSAAVRSSAKVMIGEATLRG